MTRSASTGCGRGLRALGLVGLGLVGCGKDAALAPASDPTVDVLAAPPGPPAPPANGRGGMRSARIYPLELRFLQGEIEGPLDRNLIRRHLKRNRNQLLYCYEHELMTTPTLDGAIALAFEIDSKGRVRSATATGGNRAVERCMVKVLRQTAFPPSPGAVVKVRYPIEISRPPRPSSP